MAKLMEKLGIEKFNVVGTSYGGFVAYHMAKMWPEKVAKVVIASSGINMRKCDSESLLQRSNCECIEKVMLPSTATELRTLMALASSSRILRMFPDALWNDVINVSSQVLSSSFLPLGKKNNSAHKEYHCNDHQTFIDIFFCSKNFDTNPNL